MRNELDEALCRDFPKLFSKRHKSPTESCFSFGFECGEGWEPLLRRAAEKLEALNNTLENPDDYVRVSQIKEKYGTLRFYVGSVPSRIADEVDKITHEAEEASEVTCEQCGKPGQLRGGSWVYVACEEHK